MPSFGAWQRGSGLTRYYRKGSTVLAGKLLPESDAPAGLLHARPDRGSAFEDAGRQLAGLAGRGNLARGLRGVLAHHLLFLFNRHGVSGVGQWTLSCAARQAVFGLPDGQRGDMTRKPGSVTAGTATVCPVTTDSLSDESRAWKLRDALADHIECFETFRTRPVEAAFRTVPRHLFLPGSSLDDAYSRSTVVACSAPDGTSLSPASSPKLVATMLEKLSVAPGQRVLEIGAATGFNAASDIRKDGPPEIQPQ